MKSLLCLIGWHDWKLYKVQFDRTYIYQVVQKGYKDFSTPYAIVEPVEQILYCKGCGKDKIIKLKEAIPLTNWDAPDEIRDSFESSLDRDKHH